MAKSRKEPKVEVGQIWEEVGDALSPYVTVVAVSGDSVSIRAIALGSKKWITKARLDRFNGKRGGYRRIS